MKKLVFIMPLMAISLLASCNSNTEYCTVGFDTDGGSYIAPQKVIKGKTATPPTTEPTHSFTQEYTFSFDGWDFDFAAPITSDTTIKAKWKKETQVYTVTFNANGGELAGGAKPTLTVPYGKTFKEISGLAEQKANKSNHQFLGWAETSTDKQNISGDYVIKGDKEVFANFTPTTPVEVTFSGSSLNCTLYTADGQSATPGQKVTVPAGISTKLTVKVNDREVYLPLFEDKITITGDVSHEFNLAKKEITITVAQDSSCVITAIAETPRESLEEYKWSEISQISEMGLADTYFDVGNTKKVQLIHQDSKGDGADVISDGELYQNVRIVGFSQDKDKDGNDIGITFEFADLISDSNGCSIATQWNDTNDSDTANHNYLDSSVRMALVGEKQDKGHILLAQKEKTSWSTEDDYKKPILSMLPTELTGVLIAPQKTVLCFKNDPNDIEDWEEKEIVNENNEYDKLFLLSPEEMGSNDTREGAYAYYQEEDDAKLKSLRIKKQVNRVVYSSASFIENGSGQTYEGMVQNCAGIYITNYGGYSFLRSPYIYDSSQANAIRVDGSLYIDGVCGCALAVAPAFCI